MINRYQCFSLAFNWSMQREGDISVWSIISTVERLRLKPILPVEQKMHFIAHPTWLETHRDIHSFPLFPLYFIATVSILRLSFNSKRIFSTCLPFCIFTAFKSNIQPNLSISFS